MKLELCNWGLLEYSETLARMTELQQRRINDLAPDSLVVVEHPAVITVGRLGGTFYVSMEELKRRGVEVFNVGRAGEATVYNPGQVVIYPVIHLKKNKLSPRHLVEDMVMAFVEVCRHFNVPAYADLGGRVGVWVQDRKLAAIGMQITEGVTIHGISLNVNNELDLFSCINACGQGRPATNLARESDQAVSLRKARFLCVETLQAFIARRMLGNSKQGKSHLQISLPNPPRLNY